MAGIMPFVALTALATPAHAADTWETFEPGALDFELYLGYDGLGTRSPTQRLAFGDLMLGFGLLERLSTILGTVLQGNGRFSSGEGLVYFGLFGTPLDTRHLDFDLLLILEAGGPGLGSFAVTPGFELNFDVSPEMRSFGVYLRGWTRLSGETAPVDPGQRPSDTFHYALQLTLGAYYTIARRHQLHLESSFTFRPRPRAGERRREVGGLALGYNVAFHDRLELVSQVMVDLPQAGEKACVCFMTGLIVTLPARPR
jgi:hypothetical protein